MPLLRRICSLRAGVCPGSGVVLAAIAFGVVALQTPRVSRGEPSIRIVGGGSIRASARRTPDDPRVRVEGAIIDELGAPIRDVRIVIAGASGDARCRVYAVSSAQGRFDAELPCPATRVRFTAEGLHEYTTPAEESVVETSRIATMLTVVAPSAVDLDASGAAAVLVRLTTTASGSDELPSNGAPRSRAATNRRGLEIELSSDGAVLDRATTDQHGHVTFQIAPARLGAPGPGTLTARFKGSSALSPTTGTSSWVRTTHVRLTGVARGDAVDDMTSVEIDGAVSTTFGDSDSSWALPEGLLVEVLDGAHPERPIGAAPIDANGVYRVQVDVLQRPSRLILRIANAPQHLVTSPHEIGLVHTFDWSRLGISALVAMLLGTVVVLARETRVSRERSESAKIEAGPVTLGRRDSLIPQRSEIAGSIIDAATGSAIEGARIAVTGTETSCIADSEGRFQVDVARLSGGAMELDITAPHYVRERVRVSVPHRGEWSGFTLRLTSLRLRVLGAHVRMSKAIDPDTRPGFTTIADTRALGGAEVDQLCDVIEASAYAEGTPHPEHVERIHQRAELVRDTKKD